MIFNSAHSSHSFYAQYHAVRPAVLQPSRVVVESCVSIRVQQTLLLVTYNGSF